MDLIEFNKLPIMGILRDIDEHALYPVVELSAECGLKAIEITMNTENAAGLVKKACNMSKKSFFVGAGTVLDMAMLKHALDAGASFIVSPCLIPDVASYCAKHNVPFFPGALTPSEVYAAYLSGACMVKVFPAGLFGPSYFRDLRGPFKQIKLLACGGLHKGNIKSFFSAGADAAAFGESIYRKSLIKAGDFKQIGMLIRELVSAYKEKPA
jgi:2-dehydro-3-deoxyphosphogluconate aldolase / (4S)-4-hydroxy-2-oxoglutarate aldolase